MSQVPSNLGLQVSGGFGGLPKGLPDPGSLYQSVEKQLQGYGNAQQAALQQNYQNALGMAQQQMVQSGLSGTSVAPSIGEGYMKQYQLALNNLNQTLTQTQLGAQSTFGLGGIQAAQSQQGLALQQQGTANQLQLGQENVGLGYAQNATAQQGNNAYAQAQQAQIAANSGANQGYNWNPSNDVAGMFAQSYADGSNLFG